MDIRLVCSDIDGTLLQYGKKELEGEIFDQIRALHQRGIWFCPASGRQYMPFLENVYKTNPLKGEYFLPFVVDELLQEKKSGSHRTPLL